VPSHRGQTSAAVLTTFKAKQTFPEKTYRLTLHPQAYFLQVSKPEDLCTTCEGVTTAVGRMRKSSGSGQSTTIPSSVLPATGHRSLITGPCPPKPAPSGPIRDRGVPKQGFGRGFSQLTFSVG